MRGLTLIAGDPARLRLALELAAAQAALGGAARLFCHQAAAAALVAGDDTPPPPGLPTTAQLLDDALALGVAVMACQTGLALAGIAASSLDPRVATGGLVSVLSALGEDRLAIA